MLLPTVYADQAFRPVLYWYAGIRSIAGAGLVAFAANIGSQVYACPNVGVPSFLVLWCGIADIATAASFVVFLPKYSQQLSSSSSNTSSSLGRGAVSGGLYAVLSLLTITANHPELAPFCSSCGAYGAFLLLIASWNMTLMGAVGVAAAWMQWRRRIASPKRPKLLRV